MRDTTQHWLPDIIAYEKDDGRCSLRFTQPSYCWFNRAAPPLSGLLVDGTLAAHYVAPRHHGHARFRLPTARRRAVDSAAFVY